MTLEAEAATPVERTLARELSLLRVTHVQHPGPKGGRPKEREFYVDDAGVKLLLDTLPPADRLKFGDGTELACRGNRAGDTVDALVPTIGNDALHVEFMRRQQRAFLEDLDTQRRTAIELHTLALKNQGDQLKMFGAMADQHQAMMERYADALTKREQRDDEDLVNKVIGGLADQFLGPGGGLKEMLKAKLGG